MWRTRSRIHWVAFAVQPSCFHARFLRNGHRTSFQWQNAGNRLAGTRGCGFLDETISWFALPLDLNPTEDQATGGRTQVTLVENTLGVFVAPSAVGLILGQDLVRGACNAENFWKSLYSRRLRSLFKSALMRRAFCSVLSN